MDNIKSVEEAISSDPSLTEKGKKALLAMYKVLTEEGDR